jgi:hypothetical protein
LGFSRWHKACIPFWAGRGCVLRNRF